jgi:polar amino acid transport system substrate-binding protein
MLLLMLACAPRDPRETLAHVRGHTLRAGVAENPPYLVRRGAEATGPEAELIRGFASTLGANVQWVWGSQEVHFRALHEFHLDLAGGGITDDTPWKKEVAVTRPFLEASKDDKHVFAVPPGENAFLEQLEIYLAAHRPERWPE